MKARPYILLALIAGCTSLPFIHRAYFVDDYYFVTMAKGILQHPARPYDFRSDDAGLGNVAWERGQLPRMVNPPLLHYYLAAIMKLFGEEIWKLRAGYLLFSLISLLSMYELGKRFQVDSLYSTLLMAVTPAFWLTSYSLLIDGALLAFLLASLLAYILAHEQNSKKWAIISGVLMGLTMLTKYFGALVVVLAFAWQWSDAERRRWKPGYWPYAIFVLIQVLWAVWNIATYGQSHLLAAMGRGMTTLDPQLLAYKSVVVASFIGGGTLFVLSAVAIIGRLSLRWLIGIVALALGFYALLISPWGGFDRTQSLLLSLFSSGTVAFLVIAVKLDQESPSLENKFLLWWVFLGIVELAIVMPWTAGRYLLSVLPALCWLGVWQLETLELQRWKKPILIGMALCSLLIAHADYVQANAVIKLAERFALKQEEVQKLAPKPAHEWYYLTDTFDGAQAYMEPLGWKTALPGQAYKKGDLLMRAYYRKSSWWNISADLRNFKPILQIEMRSKNPIRVMDVPASAGFYASAWGALLWTITSHPLERYELYQSVNE